MTDFFISYTAVDGKWAVCIAWVLEHAGYTVVIQDWDFAAGSNFVLEMQKAAAAKQTIAVLSTDYLKESRFGAAEWAAAFANDPDGMKRTLVPVRVRDCSVAGLLKSVVDTCRLGRANRRGAAAEQPQGGATQASRAARLSWIRGAQFARLPRGRGYNKSFGWVPELHAQDPA